MKKAYVAIVLCAFAVPSESIADVHKCADANGNITALSPAVVTESAKVMLDVTVPANPFHVDISAT